MTVNQGNSEPGGIRGRPDGLGSADHDQPYLFGHRPSADTTYPFNTREFVRLLVLRGRIQDGDYGERNRRYAA